MSDLLQSNENKIDQYISAFPGPLVLRSSPIKWWIVMTLSFCMAAASIFVAYIGLYSYLHPENTHGGAIIGVLVGLFGAIGFGSGVPLGLIAIRRSSLRLDKDGFVATLYSSKTYRWDEVSDFATSSYQGYSSVTFNTKGGSRSILAWLNSFYMRRDEYLQDTYGLSVRDLLRLMDSWRRLAIQS